MYFEQLMIESQENEVLDKLLWEQFANPAELSNDKENV